MSSFVIQERDLPDNSASSRVQVLIGGRSSIPSIEARGKHFTANYLASHSCGITGEQFDLLA